MTDKWNKCLDAAKNTFTLFFNLVEPNVHSITDTKTIKFLPVAPSLSWSVDAPSTSLSTTSLLSV